jgi:hypothetical protein
MLIAEEEEEEEEEEEGGLHPSYASKPSLSSGIAAGHFL